MTNGKENSRVVWNLGAHQGEDTTFFDTSWTAYALEANPYLRHPLELKLDKRHIISAALVPPSYTSQKIEFFFSPDRTEWGTTAADRLKSGSKLYNFTKVAVDTITLNDLTDRWPLPDLIIADLEGAELKALIEPFLDLHLKFKKTRLIIEISKDNWRLIIDKLKGVRSNFTILISAEVSEDLGNSNQRMSVCVCGNRYRMNSEGGTRRISSKIGKKAHESYLASTKLIKLDFDTSVFWLETWFKGKNTYLHFNEDVWVDLLVWE